MNLLVVTQYFWPENFRINDLVLDLHSKGHKITVFTGLPNYPDGKIYSGYGLFSKYIDNYKGIVIKRVPLIPRGKGGRVQLALNYFSFIFFSCLLAPFRLRENYDVTFVYEPSPITVCLPAILIKKIKKTPIIFWVQDLWPESLSATGAIQSTYLLRLINRLVKFIYRACDLILVQSKAFIPSIERFGVQADKIRYYPNSAEKIYKPIDRQVPNKYKKEMPDGFRIIFAGNIGAAQSMETIINAATILKDHSHIQWIIIGNGRKRNWMENEIKKNKIDDIVHILGQKPLKEMPYYFAMADLLLVTLKRDPIFALTIPSKIQSYLACGKPILAAIDGEAAQVIKESGAGIAATADDAEELADAVLNLFKMSAKERQEMGSRGRKYFEKNFESTKLVNELENWLIELS